MKLKKTLAFICAVTMLALTACGDTAGSTADKSSSESKSGSDSTASQAAGESGSDGGAVSVSEEDLTLSTEIEVSAADKQREEFYKQLDEEFQKYGRSGLFDSIGEESRSSPLGGKGYAYYYGRDGKPYIYCEDGSYADLSQYGEDGYGFIYFIGDKLYHDDAFSNNTDGDIIEIDMKGNKTRSFSKAGSLMGVTARGDLLFKKANGGIFLCKAGEEKLIDISKLPADAGHGMSDGFDLSKKLEDKEAYNVYSGSYDNKMYICLGEKENYYLDCDKAELHKVNVLGSASKCCIGKYMLKTTDQNGEQKKFSREDDSGYAAYFYDMETDTYVEGISVESNCMQSYCGGDTVMANEHGRLYSGSKLKELKLPYFEGAEVPASTAKKDSYTGYEIVKEFDGTISSEISERLSKTHYSVTDEYGIFIHSFENGAADELAVLKY